MRGREFGAVATTVMNASCLVAGERVAIMVNSVSGTVEPSMAGLSTLCYKISRNPRIQKRCVIPGRLTL